MTIMTYDLNEVEDYTTKIRDVYSQTYKDGIEPNHYHDWNEIEENLNLLARSNVKQKQNPMYAAIYAQAILSAVLYLRNKVEREPITDGRKTFISEHTNKLTAIVATAFPKKKFKEPREAQSTMIQGDDWVSNTQRAIVFTEEKAAKRQGTKQEINKKVHQGKEFIKEEVKGLKDDLIGVFNSLVPGIAIETPKPKKQVDPVYNAFINSEPFKALKDYAKFLKNDKRSHTYLFGLVDLSEKNKGDTLQELLQSIKNAANTQPTYRNSIETPMDKVNQILTEFFGGKGRYFTDDKTADNRTPYEILNSGQNITTRFFAPMGMETSTIKKINALADSIGFDYRSVKTQEESNTHRTKYSAM